jgi:RNA polymerase sigma factor (sigma-70 family)
MDDDIADLLDAAADGDQAAWDAIVERYSNLLWSIARSYRLGDADAADVLQTVWMRLVENLGRIADPARLAGWLATVARHEIHRMHRKGRRISLTAEDAALDAALASVAGPVPGPDVAALTADRDRRLWVAFAELSTRCQELLRTVVTGSASSEPLAYREASGALGMPVGGIGPTRMRCLTTLREIVRRHGINGEPEVS